MGNINKSTRTYIENSINNYLDNDIDVDEACYLFADRIYELLEYYDNDFYAKNFDAVALYSNTIAHTVASVAFLDSYKFLKYSCDNIFITNYDMLKLDLLNSVRDVNQLYDCFPVEDFADMIMMTYDFNLSSGLNKVLEVRCLSEDENNFLLDVCPNHQEDIERYGKGNMITLDRLVRSFNAERRHLHDIGVSDCESYASDNIISFIKKLYIYDRKNADSILLELAKSDYMVSKFVIGDVIDIDELNKHIEFYSNNDNDEIIDRLLNDSYFMEDAVYTGLVSLGNKDYAGKKIDNYYISDEITRKLTKRN